MTYIHQLVVITHNTFISLRCQPFIKFETFSVICLKHSKFDMAVSFINLRAYSIVLNNINKQVVLNDQLLLWKSVTTGVSKSLVLAASPFILN